MTPPSPPLFPSPDGPTDAQIGSEATPVRLSAADLGKRMGVSDETVYGWRDGGMPHTKTPDGKYWFEAEACERWRARHIPEKSHGGKRPGAGRKKNRLSGAAREELPLVKAARSAANTASVGQSELRGVALQEERLKRAAATLKEIEVAEKYGQLVARETVIADLRAAFAGMRKTIERMGPSLTPEIMSVLAGKIGPEEQSLIQRVLDDFGERMLAELCATPQVVGLSTVPESPRAAVAAEGVAA